MDSLINLIGSDFLVDIAKDSMRSDIAHMTIAFIIAAALHRSWVRKDITEQFSLITKSIDNLTSVMGTRIDNLDHRINRLEDRRRGEFE